MKTAVTIVLTAAVGFPVAAQAQAPAGEAKSPHTLTANIGVHSDYRFRGISQTFGKPAIQGGFDYSHESGVYLGNWNSNVSETAGYPDGNLEMDFYGGYKAAFGDFGVDVGVLHYSYPGTTAGSFYAPTNFDKSPAQVYTGSKIDNTEFYIAGSWKFVSLKYSHAITDYFRAPDTEGSRYLDLSASYDLGDGWGVSGHVGRLVVRNYGSASYTDYKLGATKDVGGFLFGAAYITTNAKDDCGSAAPVCSPTAS